MDHSIVGICQIFNEIEKGNLERFIDNISPYVTELVVYDDGSTDGSYEHLKKHTKYILRSDRNEFCNEISHKEQLVQVAKGLNPDFILWLDADEVLSKNALHELPKLCNYCIENNIDGVSFQELNLWRSNSWKRIDNLYNDGWFVRLWRVTPDLHYDTKKSGLHQTPYPDTIKNIIKNDTIKVIHYGFFSDEAIARKFITYRKYGQKGFLLYRFLEEKGIKLEKVSKEVFPSDLWFDDEPPKRRSIVEALKFSEITGNKINNTKEDVSVLLILDLIDFVKYRTIRNMSKIWMAVLIRIVKLKKAAEFRLLGND